MAKQDVMDIWSALQWAVRDQKADRAFAANDDFRHLSRGGSVTAAVMQMGELNARIDGGGSISGADLDPDAERIWMGMLLLWSQWRAGGLRDQIGVGLPVHMQRAMVRMSSDPGSNPVAATLEAARTGDMPEWLTIESGQSRRVVEESKLFYVMVWDVLAALYNCLVVSDSMGIDIKMPSIPRLPWQSRKKVFDKVG
ncbi:hypothetical protein [Thalassospira sp.]|uniref:hypothetical protein n=1 Tax=Thalassospira sp. TaxID=1912094 RepID=UPI000C354AB5|nr:hypothetical protein [Thalassospira sp.]MBC05711.1 hypothetical protein [Thalassospira sp.]|tara:strand:+ start:1553 stop:2143 length:591 start_codon:yes stop_codon:yes gene_type:complete